MLFADPDVEAGTSAVLLGADERVRMLFADPDVEAGASAVFREKLDPSPEIIPIISPQKTAQESVRLATQGSMQLPISP